MQHAVDWFVLMKFLDFSPFMGQSRKALTKLLGAAANSSLNMLHLREVHDGCQFIFFYVELIGVLSSAEL